MPFIFFTIQRSTVRAVCFFNGGNMNTGTSFFRYAAAELFSLFINMTFAVSAKSIIRFICLVCTVLILVAVMADYGIKAAERDKNRSNAEKNKALALSAAAVTALPLISWLLLCFSAGNGGFEFYGLHKLINGPFLQYYNLIDPGTSAKALSAGKLLAMLPPSAVPAASLAVSYITAGRQLKKQG